MRAAFVYLGTIIGAGFASGRELWLFFAAHGSMGLLAVLLAGLLFCLIGAGVVVVARKTNAQTFQEVLSYFFSPKLTRLFDAICLLSLYTSLSVMFSGFAHLEKHALGIPLVYSYAFFFLALVLFLKSNDAGLHMVNQLLVPFMLACMLYLSWHNLAGNRGLPYGPAMPASVLWPFWQAGIYVGCNFFSCFAILVPMAHKTKHAAFGAACGGLGLGLLGAIFVFVLQKMPEAALYQMPFFYLATVIGPGFALLYMLVLASAIFTTAIANAYGLQSRFADRTKRDLAIFIPAAALPIAFLGDFSALVGKIYPFFGYMGFLLLLILFSLIIKNFCLRSR